MQPTDPFYQVLKENNFPEGDCVICGQKTIYQLYDSFSGSVDFVCHPDWNDDSLDCKEVWRYRTLNDHLCENRPEMEEDEYEDYFYKDRNWQHCIDSYKAYISSPEWKIKANAVKSNKGWCCEKCGSYYARKLPLDAHHKNYKNLYRETGKDIMVVCRKCHSDIHRKKRTNK